MVPTGKAVPGDNYELHYCDARAGSWNTRKSAGGINIVLSLYGPGQYTVAAKTADRVTVGRTAGTLTAGPNKPSFTLTVTAPKNVSLVVLSVSGAQGGVCAMPRS